MLKIYKTNKIFLQVSKDDDSIYCIQRIRPVLSGYVQRSMWNLLRKWILFLSESGGIMAKINLKTLAYNSIREKIVTCEYAPGTNLNEEMLTESLGLSRTPVRDALSRLEQEGLIEILPKRGITIKSLTLNDMNMIFEVRLLYEPYILRTYGNLLSEDKMKEMFEIFRHTEIEDECRQDKDYFYRLDQEFHDFIVNACPNQYIQNSYHLIRTQDERLRHMTGDISNVRLKDTFREHAQILLPCLQKDWERAAEQLIGHLNESRNAAFRLAIETMNPSVSFNL